MGMLSDFSSLLRGAQDFVNTVKTVRSQIESLKQQRENVLAAPAARSDIKAMYLRWIDDCAGKHREMLQHHMAGVLRKARQCDDLKSVTAGNLIGVASIGRNSANGPDPKTVDIVLMAMLGDQAKKFISAAIDALDWPADEGLPLEPARQESARDRCAPGRAADATRRAGRDRPQRRDPDRVRGP
jgi:hypothetical protein